MFSEDVLIDLALKTLILGPSALLWVIFVVRNIGLRTFSKMTAFDFVATVSTGSLLANCAMASNWQQYIQAAGGMTTILVTQYILAKLRYKSDVAAKIMMNNPVLLVYKNKWDYDMMKRVRVSESDIFAKLREANATDLSKVKAVILETTGDISVLHADVIDKALLKDVQNTK